MCFERNGSNSHIKSAYTIANLLHCVSLLVTISETIVATIWRYMAVSSSVGVTDDSDTGKSLGNIHLQKNNCDAFARVSRRIH